MPTQTLNFFDLSYISTDDPDGFSNNGGYQFDWGVSTVTIAPGATEQAVSVDDIDSTFDDDQDANQTLNGPATLNGISYPDGSWIQSEYSMVVRDSLGNDYTLQFVSAGTDAYNIVGFVVQGPVPPFGEALTVMSTADNNSGTYAYSTSSPACFGRRSRIATTRGHIPAMNLQAGDVVVLADGNTARVELVLFSAATGVSKEGRPIRIRQDAFGPGLPKRDLILSAQHRVWVPALGALVAAKALVCLPRVGRVKSAAREELVHVVLRTHDVLLAEGLACESYWPGRAALSMLPEDARRRVRRIMGRAVPAMPFMRVQEAMRRLDQLGLAAPVGRIAKRAEQERDVVVGVGIGHAEADRHNIKEQRIGQIAARGAEVIAGVEDQLVDARLELVGGQDRTVGPPVVIGDEIDKFGPRLSGQAEQRHRNAFGGQTGGGVEDMGRKVSFGHRGSVSVAACAGVARVGCMAQNHSRTGARNTNPQAATGCRDEGRAGLQTGAECPRLWQTADRGPVAATPKRRNPTAAYGNPQNGCTLGPRPSATRGRRQGPGL